MPKIYLRIRGRIKSALSGEFPISQNAQQCFSFNVPWKKSPNVTVKAEIFCLPSQWQFEKKTPGAVSSISEYDLQFASVRASCKARVSDDFLDALKSGANTENELPTTALQTELNRLYYGMSEAANEALLLLKYGLHFSDVAESPFAGSTTLYWSVDGSDWKNITLTINLRGIIDPDEVMLDKETETQIQRYIDSRFSPFFALSPLHRAKNEPDPRYKIIYAAYAAELAIKEFLIEFTKKDGKSALEPLLVELSSPPLGLLYGKILKSYTSRWSPKKDEMDELSKERNSLMHKPQRRQIELATAEKYVRDAEGAIFHLLHILYETDPLIERLCKKYNKKAQPKTS
jgi:hypothetical protein